jgi:hypothetical protein
MCAYIATGERERDCELCTSEDDRWMEGAAGSMDR